MRWLFLFLLLPQLALAAASNVFTSPHDTARLISAANTASGGQMRLALEISLKPGWHIYWRNPGAAGFAPQLSSSPPVQLGPLDFPAPTYLKQDGIAAYVLSGHVVLPFTAMHTGNKLGIHAHWLVCSNICIPEQAYFTLILPGGGPSAEAGLFPKTPRITPSPFATHLAPGGRLIVTGPSAAQVAKARFFPDQPGDLDDAAPQRLSFTANGFMLRLHFTQPSPTPLTGVLEITDPSGAKQALALSAAAGPAPNTPPYWALALLGGLILNLMPCVFPILAMKALALTRMSGAAHGHIRREALGYTLGVLGAMLALAGILLGLRAAGNDIFWGFQFQSPVFVALAAWVVFAAALSLAGLYTLNAPGFIRRIPAQHSVATGLLAVLLATPCTAPFMGVAIAAALALPTLPALVIFVCLGLGLALPILLIALVPSLAARLPRPGVWMRRLQHLLSLPMFASFIWLAWVLFRQAGPAGLGLLLAGAAILLLGLWRKPVLALGALALLPLLHAAPRPALTLPGAQAYTQARLASLRAQNRPVFIDLTAAWCVTCLVNETTTLATPAARQLFARHHVALLVGDWTDKNPAITALLATNHRAGVPLYLYYPPQAAAPIILPQILTPGLLARALNH